MTTQTYTFCEDTVSDLHKDAYGFRPSQNWWMHWEEATDDAKQAIWDDLISALEDSINEQKIQQKKAIESFEALVKKNIEYGAKDRADAIAWICDSYDCENAHSVYGWNYLEYEMGLPYGYISGIKPGFLA